MKIEEKEKEPLRARTNSWIKRAGMRVGESLRRTSSSNNGDIKEGWRAATIPDGQNNGNGKGTAEKAASSSVPSTPSAWASPDPSWRDSTSLVSSSNQKMARQRSKNSINNGNNNNHDVLATDQSPNTEKQKQQPSKSNTSADNNRNHNKTNWRGSETAHKFVREGSWITEEKEEEEEEDDGEEEGEGSKMNSGRAWRGRRVRKREKVRIVAEGMAALLCGLSDEEEAWHGEYEGETPKRQLLVQV